MEIVSEQGIPLTVANSDDLNFSDKTFNLENVQESTLNGIIISNLCTEGLTFYN